MLNYVVLINNRRNFAVRGPNSLIERSCTHLFLTYPYYHRIEKVKKSETPFENLQG